MKTTPHGCGFGRWISYAERIDIMDWSKFANQHLMEIMPYVPGKPVEEVQRELGLSEVHKLASNENILGPSPKAVEAIKKAASEVNFYPDGSCYYLVDALARKHGVKPEQIVIGNGTDEVIRLLCNALLGPDGNVVYAWPSFVMYKISSMVMNAQRIEVPLRDTYTHDLAALAAAVTDKTRMVMVCNPNNPTGTIVKKAEVDAFLDKLPAGVLAVFDEAYFEYVEDADSPDSLDYFKAGRPVVCLRTFSKAYGLAGLRVGYGIMDASLAGVLHRVRNPFNVNAIAQAAATAAAGDTEHLAAAQKFNSDGKNYLHGEFDRMGLPYAASQANFVLVDIKRDAQEVFEALLKKGVIVRPGKFLGFPTHLRVSIGDDAGNKAFIKELEVLLGSYY
jgi:histidinol-phosphate aminotransferase